MTYRHDNELLPYLNEPRLPRFTVALSIFCLGMMAGLMLVGYFMGAN